MIFGKNVAYICDIGHYCRHKKSRHARLTNIPTNQLIANRRSCIVRDAGTVKAMRVISYLFLWSLKQPLTPVCTFRMY